MQVRHGGHLADIADILRSFETIPSNRKYQFATASKLELANIILPATLIASRS